MISKKMPTYYPIFKQVCSLLKFFTVNLPPNLYLPTFSELKARDFYPGNARFSKTTQTEDSQRHLKTSGCGVIKKCFSQSDQT